jgi:3-phosphoshikimate 1-carboxyvinyltransferase
MGADISGCAASGGTTVRPPERLEPLVGAVPGDISSATFWLVAALLAPQADLTLEYVGVNRERAAIVEVLQSWGANIEVADGPDWYGEPTATLRVRGATQPLSGGTIGGDLAARLIDELPALALLGASTRDGLEVRDAAELRVKESDRIATVAAALRALGGELDTFDDGLAVPGGQPLHGGVVDAAGDHRIALAAAAVAVGVTGKVEIDGAEVADVSYPGFRREFLTLGGAA